MGIPPTPIPSYQQGIDMTALDRGGSNVYRNVPDVAMVADRVEYILFGAPGGVAGISVSAPLWAGFMALVNQQNAANGLGPVGFVNPVLYAIAETSGAAGASDVYKKTFTDIQGPGNADHTATAGYDLVTGLGSPKCELINQLTSSSPAPNWYVAVGTSHACAVRGDSSWSCWGDNSFGQIGNPAASSPQLTPLPVTGLPGGEWTVASMAAGGSHTCVALQAPRNVYCWGANGNGQLGIGSASGPSPTVNVPAFSGALALAAGGSHTCALMPDHSVACTGFNGSGQLGTGDTVDRATPEPVNGLADVSGIAAGQWFTCAIVGGDSHVECWGNKLGHGNVYPDDFQLTPAPVADLSGVASLAAGSAHVCALMQDTSVRCWGLNNYGELGDGTTNGSLEVPTAVVQSCSGTTDPLTNVRQVAVGWSHSCALMLDGTVQCWGRNDLGELGDGTDVFSRSCPAPVQFLTDVTALSTMALSTCSLAPKGISCWGVLAGSGGDMHKVPSTVHFF
jgi:alpha-tubulin suppressor-like RCC1 family protein